MALMSFTETAAAGRAFARTDEPSPRPNAELLATGVANAAGAFMGSMPGGGGTSQTAVNRMTGARTQIAGLVTASMALLTMVLLAPLLALMPHAVLASIVIVYSVGLILPAEFRSILQVRRTEFIWAIAALLGVMLLGTLKGILARSLSRSLRSRSRPRILLSTCWVGSPGRTCSDRARPSTWTTSRSRGCCCCDWRDGCSSSTPSDAEKLRPLIAEAKPRVVAFDLSGVFDLEYSALKMLTEGEKRQREAGVMVWLVGLGRKVYAVVRRSPLVSSRSGASVLQPRDGGRQDRATVAADSRQT